MVFGILDQRALRLEGAAFRGRSHHAALPGAEGLSVDQASEVQATGESNSGELPPTACKLPCCQERRLGRSSALCRGAIAGASELADRGDCRASPEARAFLYARLRRGCGLAFCGG